MGVQTVNVTIAGDTATVIVDYGCTTLEWFGIDYVGGGALDAIDQRDEFFVYKALKAWGRVVVAEPHSTTPLADGRYVVTVVETAKEPAESLF